MTNLANAGLSDSQLQKRLTQMTATLEQLDAAIAWINAQGQVEWCNAHFTRLLPQLFPTPPDDRPLIEAFPLIRQGEPVAHSMHPLTRAFADEPAGKECYEIPSDRCNLPIEITWSPLAVGTTDAEPLIEGPSLFVIRHIAAPMLASQSLLPGDIVLAPDTAVDTGATAGSLSDLAELIQTRQALQQSEEQLRFALESADMGMWSWDLTTGQEIWSTHSQMLLGYEVGTFGGTIRHFMERVHPEDRDRVQRSHREALQTGVYNCEFRVVLPSGSIRWIAAKGKVFYSDRGVPVKVSGIDMDITERKQVEAALRRQKEHLRLILDNIPQQVFWKDRDLVFQGCNKNWAEAAFLSSPDVVIGKTDYDLLPDPEVAESFRSQDRRIMESNIPQLHHIATKQRPSLNGQVVWLDISKIPMHDASGNVIGILGVLDDITQRKLAEEQLKASLQEKEVLLKEIHHRVKNNLQMVFSLLNLQASAIQSEEIQNVLKDTQSRVKAMALIHEKLYQSRSLSKIRFVDYIQQLTTDLLQSYRPNAHDINLIFQIDDIEVTIDTVIPCGLIVGELVANAIKYAFPNNRSGWIRIAFFQDQAQGYVLEVADNGIGISEDINFRETKSLGLQLVCAFAHQLRGTIDLNRTSGSAFKITFNSLL